MPMQPLVGYRNQRQNGRGRFLSFAVNAINAKALLRHIIVWKNALLRSNDSLAFFLYIKCDLKL